MPNTGDPPSSDDQGQSDEPGLSQSEHARQRAGQGRPVPQVASDVQKAGPNDVFVQVDDGRFVVRGAKGREHILEPNGEHVTSVRRLAAAQQARLRSGVIRPATDEEIEKVKAFIA